MRKSSVVSWQIGEAVGHIAIARAVELRGGRLLLRFEREQQCAANAARRGRAEAEEHLAGQPRDRRAVGAQAHEGRFDTLLRVESPIDGDRESQIFADGGGRWKLYESGCASGTARVDRDAACDASCQDLVGDASGRTTMSEGTFLP
ncbi:MAG: hypothetical protein ACREU3_06040 [Steroidobacteraceae bacterium]